jgi:hypothetical protein
VLLLDLAEAVEQGLRVVERLPFLDFRRDPARASRLRRTLVIPDSKSNRSERRPPLPKSRSASAAWPRVI